ncbi:45831_t:CDS:2 [Gigaspora margarita]|uniref:45831_t:CDS:1 n=1 Tax=Gigaspora margarita TaxID=4874 RepID=A0ABM8VZJ7_GIGMA|nr:45831_t:CDS:2 [Gigaspora margarita]
MPEYELNLFKFEHSHQNGIGIKKNEFKDERENKDQIIGQLKSTDINNGELRKVNMLAPVKDRDDHKNKSQMPIYPSKSIEVGYTNATLDPWYCNHSDNDMVKDGKPVFRQEWISEGKSTKPSRYKDGKRKYVPERLKTINNIATSYHQKIPEDIMLIIFLSRNSSEEKWVNRGLVPRVHGYITC